MGDIGERLNLLVVVPGSMRLVGNIGPVQGRAESLLVEADVGAKRSQLAMAGVGDVPTIPGELLAGFPTRFFYSDPWGARFKAPGRSGWLSFLSQPTHGHGLRTPSSGSQGT